MSTFNIAAMLEVDSAYDDPAALIEDLKQAVDNEEDVAIHIAGHEYHVAVIAIGDATGAEL